jgi:SAM-dependent methyltransferase
MQKVVGSSPIIRSLEGPGQRYVRVSREPEDMRREPLGPWAPAVPQRHGALGKVWFRLPPFTRNVVRLSVGRAAPLWGNLQRLRPFSDNYGSDRGLPVDRVYVEQFLAAQSADIQGRVLEVGSSDYTTYFGGGRVSRSDVVDVRPDNTSATLIADLCEEGSLPANRFDCFVFTQTLHLLREPSTALANIWQSLTPGGVLLLTVPTISRVDPVEQDYWRFTPLGLQAFFDDHWPAPTVEIRSYGNLTTALATLLGLATHEVRSRRLDAMDHSFPLIVGARARKSQ